LIRGNCLLNQSAQFTLETMLTNDLPNKLVHYGRELMSAGQFSRLS
jgi:hypothetical protein